MNRLALELGAPHREYLEEELSMRQVSEWADYYSEEPFGYDAIDTRNALLAHVMATSQGAKRKDGKPFELETFRLRPRVEQPSRPGYELADKIRALFKIPRPKEG